MMEKKLKVLKDSLAVCKFASADEVPALSDLSGFYSLTKTEDELSLVCLEKEVPSCPDIEKGWRAFKVIGPLDFSLTGIVSNLSHLLAEAEIPVFVISTFDTDYILVKENNLDKAIIALSSQWDITN